MAQIKFSANIPSPPEKLIGIITDFENLTRFFQYLEYVKIIEQNDNVTITEEKASFAFHSMKYDVVQQTKTLIEKNRLYSEVLSGPLKGTTLEVIFDANDMGTNVQVDSEIKVGLKFKMMLPLVKNRMKMAVIAVLYKMHTIITEQQE